MLARVDAISREHLFRMTPASYVTFVFCPDQVDESLFEEKIRVRATGYGNNKLGKRRIRGYGKSRIRKKYIDCADRERNLYRDKVCKRVEEVLTELLRKKTG